MEHLPQPMQPHKGIRCRYVPNTYGPAPKDACGFFEFERLSNFRFTKVLRGQYEDGLTSQHLEGLFQAWLYFSLLREVFGHSADVRDYICRDRSDGHDYLSTSRLKDYIEKWREQYDNTVESEKEGIKSHTLLCIRAANYFLNRITLSIHTHHACLDGEDSHTGHVIDTSLGPTRLIISPEFEVTVRVLIQSLEFELLPEDLPRLRVIDETGTHICQILTQRLLDYQWCPNKVNMLACTLDVPSLYYATLLGPDNSEKDYSACTDELCKANQVDETKYQTAHVSEMCCNSCNFAGPVFNDLEALVQDETVPLIEILSGGEGMAPRIRVHKFEDGMKYVAISHVWADGLGNPLANTLPICQLNRLSEQVKAVLPRGLLLWCDTLCVPTEPPELRRKAIWKMREVYQQAYAVLIIDASLKTASISCSAEELMMRITCSGWMRRLWTYQENALAKKLRALFGDGIANIDQAEMNTRRAYQLGRPITAACYNTSVGLEASAFYRNVRPDVGLEASVSGSVSPDAKRLLNSPDFQRGLGIGNVWESVQWRMTSRASDEPICLATVLAVNLPAILGTPEPQRMKLLFSQLLIGWPPYMIFSSYDRMSAPGWRWAPSTLMRPGSMASPKMHHMNATTLLHEEGLIVQFSGFIIDTDNFRRTLKNANAPTIDLNRMFYIKDRKTSHWYSCYRDDGQEIVSFNLDELRIQGFGKPAIIMSCPIEELLPREKAPPQLWDGLLVDVKLDVDDTIFTNYVVKVLVGMLPPIMVTEIEEAFKNPELVEAYDAPLMTYALCDTRDYPQRWCVG